jgi:3-mercaptopyruvate sulfurtransferase SseA
VSTLAAATLRLMGFTHAVALDGGLDAWREAGFALERSDAAGTATAPQGAGAKPRD